MRHMDGPYGVPVLAPASAPHLARHLHHLHHPARRCTARYIQQSAPVQLQATMGVVWEHAWPVTCGVNHTLVSARDTAPGVMLLAGRATRDVRSRDGPRPQGECRERHMTARPTTSSPLVCQLRLGCSSPSPHGERSPSRSPSVLLRQAAAGRSSPCPPVLLMRHYAKLP